MTRHTRAALILSILVAAFSANNAAASNSPRQIAFFHGKEIPLSRVAQNHCHNALGSTILCFDSQAERDASLRRTIDAQREMSPASDLSVNYVTFFADINFGGASFTTADPISDLGSIGWNDRISSFKSLNSGHPKWWKDISYSGPAWQWVAGSWVANVGSDANDQFSSVQNVP